jgi:hypothetical protein
MHQHFTATEGDAAEPARAHNPFSAHGSALDFGDIDGFLRHGRILARNVRLRQAIFCGYEQNTEIHSP